MKMNAVVSIACVLILLVMQARLAVAGEPALASSRSLSGDVIPPEIVLGAAQDANQMAGTNVQIKLDADFDSSKVLVSFKEVSSDLAETLVDHNHTPDPSDDVVLLIIIDLERLKRMFPGIMEDLEKLRLILSFLLAHEFQHVPSGPIPNGGGDSQGGHDLPAGGCEHLGTYQTDASSICAKASAIKNDPELKVEGKCRLVSALCVLYKHIQGLANKPENVAEAGNCNDVNVVNGQVVGDCIHCPAVDCPEHGHSYGD